MIVLDDADTNKCSNENKLKSIEVKNIEEIDWL